MLSKNQKISLVVIAVVVIGLYVFFNKQMVSNTQNPSGKVATTTSITGDYKIEAVPMSNSGLPQPMPDLNRPVKVSGSTSVSADALVRATEGILLMQSKLKQDPKNVMAWLDLGIYQKMAGDYEGAKISWEYVTKLAPDDFIAYGNLGNLYGYFLSDKVKAESYYKLAISKNQKQANLYIQLSEIYQYMFKDLSKAKAVIEDGLKQLPQDENLLKAKASFT